MFPRNRILGALPRSNLERYFAALEPISPSRGQLLYKPGDPITHGYFIVEGIVSTLIRMADGTMIEIAMVGFEGMVEVDPALGLSVSVHYDLVQVAGSALQVTSEGCRAAFERSAAVRFVMLRFIDSLWQQAAQSADCNRIHTVQQRFARWLLMAHDRHNTDVIPLTHDFLASMLGIRRAGVTEAARQFENAGSIRQTRGRITILSRPSIEAAACECYRGDYERFILFSNSDPGRSSAE